MRMIFGVLSLLFVVAIVGVLAKKQLGAASPPVAAPAAPGAVAAPTGTPQQQVQQVRQAVEGAIQARPLPDEAK